MSSLAALFKAILDWLTGLVRQDKKAGDADATPQSLKDRWRRRIEEQKKKTKEKDKEDEKTDSDSD